MESNKNVRDLQPTFRTTNVIKTLLTQKVHEVFPRIIPQSEQPRLFPVSSSS